MAFSTRQEHKLRGACVCQWLLVQFSLHGLVSPKQEGKKMACTLCESTSYLGITLLNSKFVCFGCILEIKKYKQHAPNPFQTVEHPLDYFPMIGAK
jgi:hypothetical protein